MDRRETSKIGVIPSYLVGIAVLAAAGFTGYAMLKSGYPPGWVSNKPYTLPASPQNWVPWGNAAIGRSPIADFLPAGMPAGGMPAAMPVAPQMPVDPYSAGIPASGRFVPPAVGFGPTAAPPAAALGQNFAPPAAGLGANFTPAAAGFPPNGTIMIMRADRLPAHGDLGLCTACHAVVDRTGASIPTIRSYSPLFHDFRGVCNNCHSIVTSAPSAPRTAARPAARPAAVATEGEFLGMELSPITALTATQFSIPAGTGGLVVVEAEGGAALAGLKPGDVLIGVDGIPIRNMTDFFQNTKNGTAQSAQLDLLRAGQQLQLRLSATPPPAPAQPLSPAVAIPPLQVNPIATIAPQQAGTPPAAF